MTASTDPSLTPANAAADAYARAVRASWRAAETTATSIDERDFLIAGLPIRICAANPFLLESMTAALAHLVSNAATQPVLRIHVWSAAPSPPSPLAWLQNSHGGPASRYRGVRLPVHGELPELNSATVRSTLHIQPNLLSCLDLAAGEAWYWMENEARLPCYEQGSPFRQIFAWFLHVYGRAFIHAAAAGNHRAAVLFAGPPGAGKSTCALSCLAGGLRFLADDYCLVSTLDTPRVYSLYSTARLDGAAALDHFPQLAPLCRNTAQAATERLQVFLHPHYTRQLDAGLPLRAILLPRHTITGLPARARATPAECLRQIAPTTIRQMPGAARDALQALGRLARQVPAYWLNTGNHPQPGAISGIVQSLIEEE